mgnify:CR=1 FL=1
MMPARSPQRVVRMVQDGAVVSVTGKVIKMRTDTVCIHGDTPGAVDIARGVRQALKDAWASEVGAVHRRTVVARTQQASF